MMIEDVFFVQELCPVFILLLQTYLWSSDNRQNNIRVKRLTRELLTETRPNQANLALHFVTRYTIFSSYPLLLLFLCAQVGRRCCQSTMTRASMDPKPSLVLFCLFGFLTFSSATRFTRLSSDNFTCFHTRDRAERP